jgi:hypothetical protein
VQLATDAVTMFPIEIEENKQAYDAIKYFYKHRKGNLLKRIFRYMRKKWNK